MDVGDSAQAEDSRCVGLLEDRLVAQCEQGHTTTTISGTEHSLSTGAQTKANTGGDNGGAAAVLADAGACAVLSEGEPLPRVGTGRFAWGRRGRAMPAMEI